MGEARYVALTPKSAFGVGKGIGIVDDEVKPGRRIDVGAGALGIIGRWVGARPCRRVGGRGRAERA